MSLRDLIPTREPDLTIELPELPPSKNEWKEAPTWKFDRLRGAWQKLLDDWAVETYGSRLRVPRFTGKVLIEVEFRFPRLGLDTHNYFSWPALFDTLTPATEKIIKKRSSGKLELRVKSGLGIIHDDSITWLHAWPTEPMVDRTRRTIIRIWNRNPQSTKGETEPCE